MCLFVKELGEKVFCHPVLQADLLLPFKQPSILIQYSRLMRAGRITNIIKERTDQAISLTKEHIMVERLKLDNIALIINNFAIVRGFL